MDVEKRQRKSTNGASKPLPPPKPKLNLIIKKRKKTSSSSLATIIQDSLADAKPGKARLKSKSPEDKSTDRKESATDISSSSEISAHQSSDTNVLLHAKPTSAPRSNSPTDQGTIIPNTVDIAGHSPGSKCKEPVSPKRHKSNSTPFMPIKELSMPLIKVDTELEPNQELEQSHSYEDMYQVFNGTPPSHETAAPSHETEIETETDFPYYEEIPLELRVETNAHNLPKDVDGYVSLEYMHNHSKSEGSTSSATTDDTSTQLTIEATTPELSLKEVTTLQSLQLPQLAKVTKGFTCPINGSVSKGDLLLLVSISKVTAVQGACTESKEPVYLLQNSNHTLSPYSEEVTNNDLLTVDQLLMLKRLPPVVKVVEPLTQTKGNVVPEGTLLFFDRDAKQQSLLLRKNYVKAKTSMGEAVMISQASKGTFSISPTLSLPEVINHIQFPFKFRLHTNPDLQPVTVTLLNVCQENVLVTQPFDLVEGTPVSQYIQLPVCWDATLQMVEVKDKERPYKIQHYSSFRLSDSSAPFSDGLDESIGYDHADNWLPNRADKVLQKQTSKSPTLRVPPALYNKPKDTSVPSQTHDTNVDYLKTLQASEILQMLEGLHMQQYQTTFEKENVDGELFSSLCEQDLLKEFNITKRLDRIRLLKVIDGSYSAQEMLSNMYI